MRTLAIVKPNALSRGGSELLLSALPRVGLSCTDRRKLQLSLADAEAFYAEHYGRFFYQRLVGFMSRGPLEAMVLEGPDAVRSLRRLIGPTHFDAAQADPECLRAALGESDTRNAYHGSDSEESAEREIKFFFEERKGSEIQ